MSSVLLDDGFRSLMQRVQRERGFTSQGYKEPCLRRRVALRLRARGLSSFDEYSTLIDRHPEELDKLVAALTINVTRFFRNAVVWTAIAEQVVPALWGREQREINAWSAGCASGEEAYSLAMLFHRHAAVNGMLAQIGRVRVLGTDVDAGALGEAERGFYGPGCVQETSDEFRERYFASQNPWVPVPGIRRMVRFARQDLLGDYYPPVAQDVILCRNVLIYFDRDAQAAVLHSLAESLAPGGYLVLGKVESLLGEVRSRFTPVEHRVRIYRKTAR